MACSMPSFKLQFSHGKFLSKENQGGFMPKNGFKQCLTQVFDNNTDIPTKGNTKIM